MAESKESKESKHFSYTFAIGRHGVRFPLKRMPGNLSWPQTTEFIKKYGGLLTSQGIDQMRLNGKWFDKVYYFGCHHGEKGRSSWVTSSEDVLVKKQRLYGQPDIPVDVEILTTDTERTVMSATAFLSGFRPGLHPGYRYRCESNPLVPVGTPITILPKYHDHYGSQIPHGFKHNPYVTKLISRNMDLHAKEVSFNAAGGWYAGLAAKLLRITELSGFSKNASVWRESDAIQLVRSQIAIENAIGMKSLKNKYNDLLTRDEINAINEFAHRGAQVKLLGINEDERKMLSAIAADYLPALILDYFESKLKKLSSASPKNDVGLSFFSAHDSTINAMYAFLMDMMVREYWLPPQFGAMLIFQLSGEHVDGEIENTEFRILYNPVPGYMPGYMRRNDVQIGNYEQFKQLLSKCNFCQRESRMLKHLDSLVCHPQELHSKFLEEKDKPQFVCPFCDQLSPEKLVKEDSEKSEKLPTRSCSSRNGFEGTSIAISEMRPNLLCLFCGLPAHYECTSCGKAFYCTKEHQKQDWNQHRMRCSLIVQHSSNGNTDDFD